MTITTELEQRLVALMQADSVPMSDAWGELLDSLASKDSENLSLKGELSRMTIYRDNAVNMRDKAHERIAELEARPEQQPVAWPNHCDKSVPAALRYLAEKPRPGYGNSPYNTEHLYQLAREIEAMAGRDLYGSVPAAQPVTVNIKWPDDGFDDCRDSWGGQARDTFDCGYNFSATRHEEAIREALTAAGITIAEGE